VCFERSPPIVEKHSKKDYDPPVETTLALVRGLSMPKANFGAVNPHFSQIEVKPGGKTARMLKQQDFQ
jgi:hypothetical protein